MLMLGMYILPLEAKGEEKNLFGTLHRFSAPYVLILSQWQQWDIFSPDPLRRVTEYRVERHAGDRFEVVRRFDYENLLPWERAKELKILGRIEDDWHVLSEAYLMALCPSLPQSAGRALRLVGLTTVIPRTLPELRHFSERPHPMQEKLLAEIRCPLHQP